MLLNENFNPQTESEICFYYSLKKDINDHYKLPNVLSTVYYKDKKVLYVKFLKERGLDINKKPIFEATIYAFSNIDKMLYDSYKNADSQSEFHKRYISKNTQIQIVGKTKLYNSEVDDLLNEWTTLVVVKRLND